MSSRCRAEHLGLGCSKEAEEGHVICASCRKIAFGPIWKDPVWLFVLAIFSAPFFLLLSWLVKP